MASRKRPRTPISSGDKDAPIRFCIELVPWKDIWELQSVGRALLSAADSPVSETEADSHPDDDCIAQALARVQEWQCHASRLPHAVEATAALATVLWREQRRNDTSATELQLAYSAAVIRAVNGLVDTLQQSRAVAMSMTALSVHLGLPTWLVEIRHDATHNQMPSVAVLRLGATTLLDYFRRAYWDPLQEAHDQIQDKIYVALEEYEYKADQMALQKDKDLPTSTSDMFAPPPTTVHHGKEKVDDQTKDSNQTNRNPYGITENNNEEMDFMAMPSEDETSENDQDLKESTEISRLGTNINMFSLLMDPPKKKKKNKNNTKKKEKKISKKQKEQKPAIPTLMPLPSLGPLARKVTQITPFPLLWHCFLTHLVWGRENSGGTLLQQGCDPRVQRKYYTLLNTVGRDLPGLMQALVIHLVDYVLRNTTSHDVDAPLYATTAVSWIKVLLSRRFILGVINTHPWSKSNDAQLANAALLPFPLPLRALLEQCQSFAQPQPALVRSMGDILLQVIGQESLVVKGLHDMQQQAPPPQKAEVVTNAEEVVVPLAKANATSGVLSLEDMESMLAQRGNLPFKEASMTETVAAPTQENSKEESQGVVAWTRCTTWEPCPIGSLPGRPT